MDIIIVIACTAAVLVAALLAVVVTGIRHEPPASEMPATAPALTAAIVRRVLGVSVRKPYAGQSARETCLTGQASSGRLEGRDQ